MAQLDETARFDHKGLIREAYRMEGVGDPEARSIFLDWALSLPEQTEQAMALEALWAHYGREAPEHPMSQVLKAAMEQEAAPRRRGGWRGRRS
ncbi:MAG: hypothetical protein JXQ91_02440 [Vannielia sp.]|uniref:hypothetical protein n=1 Tax=Rhodobacterales TaxID=204455 RepID=UPI0020955EDD|nr:hypothetical protein [Oceanicola sp. 502str15]MCO6382215.1 hypothetical protein [Oceanicola sp. 502str15]